MKSSQIYKLASENPLVVSRLLSLPSQLVRVLKWRSTSGVLLVQLLGLLESEGVKGRRSIELSNSYLGGVVWPDLSSETAKNKLTRWIQNFEQDQALSNFFAVRRFKGGMRRRKNDQVEFESSKYAVDDFYSFVEIVGCRVEAEGVLEMPTLDERTRAQGAIVANVLIDLGANAILPGMRDEDRERRAKGKETAKFEKRLQKAKQGEETLTAFEFAGLPLFERVEIIAAQFLKKGELLIHEAGYLDDVAEMKWILGKVKEKFGIVGDRAIEQRLAGLNDAERFEVVAGTQFKRKSKLRLVS